MTPKIVAGYVSFTEITDPGQHRTYNAWHQLDHLPEQLTIPGIGWGERWVRSPSCRSAAGSASAPLDATDYFTLYLMAEPVEATMGQFKALARTLADADRFHRQRRSLYSQALTVLGNEAAERVRVSAAAVPYRPSRGVHVRLDEVADWSGFGRHAAWLVTNRLERLVAVPGVAGAWSFHERPRPAEGPSRFLTVSWLDDDPAETAAAIARLPGPPDPTAVSCFDGVFEHIDPYRWDWFEGSPVPTPEERA